MSSMEAILEIETKRLLKDPSINAKLFDKQRVFLYLRYMEDAIRDKNAMCFSRFEWIAAGEPRSIIPKSDPIKL